MHVGFHMGPVVLHPYPIHQQWEEHLEQVRAARDHGFDFVSVGTHWVIDPFQYFSIVPWLARISAEVPDMMLVTSVVLLPLVNPMDMAEQLATLDVMSNGKLRFGCGLGYRPIEYEAFGVSLKQRASRFEEALTLMKRLWTEDEVTHDGRFFHITAAKPTLKPLQKPYPPVWIATNSDPATRRAARMGDAPFWSPFQPLGVLERQVAIYRATLQEVAKPWPKEVPIAREYSVGRTHAEAVREGAAGMSQKFSAYAAHGLQESLPETDKKLLDDFDGLAKHTFIVGDPAECADEIMRYQEVAGVTHMKLRLQYPGMTHQMVIDRIKLTEQVVARLPSRATP
ncbi:MAG: LLM class flavin-dependent oxidoreductase [Chloroflexota bacterium]|nr:LLM class flavin-dependent oxidoreductase [Chloroflexota bacterium]